MIDLSTRLRRARDAANMTTADLARWFGRPYPTVNGWLNGGQVGLAPLDSAIIEAQLFELEKRLKHRRGFPIPPMKRQDREAYIEKQRNGGKS